MVSTLDKHDCFIQTAEGKVLFQAFSFANNYEGFEELYSRILSCDDDNIRVGLESTLSLRKTKTDNAKTIALMLATESADNAYSFQTYQIEELKSLTRYRTDKVNQRSKLKQSLLQFAIWRVSLSVFT